MYATDRQLDVRRASSLNALPPILGAGHNKRKEYAISGDANRHRIFLRRNPNPNPDPIDLLNPKSVGFDLCTGVCKVSIDQGFSFYRANISPTHTYCRPTSQQSDRISGATVRQRR